MLFAADGETYLNHQTLPMTARSVVWFMEGRQLLQHAHELHTVRARLVCRLCASAGGEADVHVANKKAGELFVACPHRPMGGAVKLDQPLDVEPLLLTLGWALVCPACGEPLVGDNYEGSSQLTVSCPCTTREFSVGQA